MKKEYRIKKSEKIEELIKHKQFYSGKNLVLYIKENHSLNHFHYALSVSKKSGDAVQRNLLKRRVRSAVREFKLKNTYEFFIIVRKTVKDFTFNEIKNELEILFEKSNLLEK